MLLFLSIFGDGDWRIPKMKSPEKQRENILLKQFNSVNTFTPIYSILTMMIARLDQAEELPAHFRARANANDFRLFLLENCEEAAAQGR